MLSHMPLAIIIFYFILGAVLGSFGSVLITRTIAGRSIGGRSECPSCKKQLRAWELIPIFSFLFLMGRCARCRKNIGAFYPLLELLSGLLFVFALTRIPLPLPSLLLGIALWLLLLIAVIDFLLMAIPDVFTVALLFIGVVLNLSLGTNPVSGVLLGGGFFAILWVVSRGRWIGSGDVILGAAIGALLGDWRFTAVALFLTYIVGAAIASGLLLSGKLNRKSSVAFGPFLAFGTFLTILWSDRIVAMMAVYF